MYFLAVAGMGRRALGCPQHPPSLPFVAPSFLLPAVGAKTRALA